MRFHWRSGQVGIFSMICYFHIFSDLLFSYFLWFAIFIVFWLGKIEIRRDKHKSVSFANAWVYDLQFTYIHDIGSLCFLWFNNHNFLKHIFWVILSPLYLLHMFYCRCFEKISENGGVTRAQYETMFAKYLGSQESFGL